MKWGKGNPVKNRNPMASFLPTAHCLLLTFFSLFVLPAFALGPHEVLLLANQNSPRSMEMAQDYAAMRHIPAENLVALDLPASPAFEITPAEFTVRIWNPARQAIRERGLADHILAWIYSVDFPLRISATPPLSLQGLTFLKGQMPSKESVEKGTYTSPIFAGPETPRITGFPAQSLDVQNAWLGPDMPLPSMMLGYMGPNGNTREEIMACLKAGLQADRTRPEGTFLILTNNDVRTLCRAWEFTPAIRELNAQGITTRLTPTPPSAADKTTPLIGLMAGAAEIPEIAQGQFHFLPGAIAEHLTSFGAAFDNNGQTKITAWIRAGATASAGTVTEPLSLWTKFPQPRFMSHQAAGCTILESLMQSIRCPLQILLIGEPLASPWAPLSTMTLQGLEDSRLNGRKVISVKIASRTGEIFNRFMFLLDGKTLQPLGKSVETTLDSATMTSGHHKLRIVAYMIGSVRSQIFAESSFDVNPKTP